MQKSPWPGDLRSLSSILGWSWCLGKPFFLHNFCMVSSHFVFFRRFFSDGWRYLDAQCRFYISICLDIFGVVGVVGYESSLNSIAFWFQDLKVWMLKLLDSPPQQNYRTAYQRKITCFKCLGFPVVILVSVGFSFDLLRLSCSGCPGSSPSSPERKEVSWLLLQKLPWRKFRMMSCVKGCRNDLNELNNYFDINFARHTLVIQWYALQWLEQSNNTASTEKLTSLNLNSKTQSTDDKTNHSTICLMTW